MKSYLLIFLIVTIISRSYSQSETENFDFGHLDDNKYISEFFHFEFTIPSNWVVQTKEEMDRLTEQGRELVAGDDEKLQAVFKASEINVANLLAVFQFEKGAPVDYNPSVMIIAENIADAPGIKTGSDYLFQTKKILEQGQFKYDHIDEEFEKEVISETDFYKMNAEVKYLGLNIKQVYYSTIKKKFTLVVIISFVTEDQKNELLAAVHSLRFN